MALKSVLSGPLLASTLRNISGTSSCSALAITTCFNRAFHSINSKEENQIYVKKLKLNNFTKYNILGNIQPINLTINRAANLYRIGPRPDPRTEKRNLYFRLKSKKDDKYTTDPIPVQMLSGRDPDTGRAIFNTRSKGPKKYFRKILYDVPSPKEPGVFYEERVIDIIRDDFRTARLALVCNGTTLRYRIATSTMKPGDLIKSSGYIPPVAVIPKEGDTYPLGALPIGTMVCCIQRRPEEHGRISVSAGSTLAIKGHSDGKIIIQVRKKLIGLFERECLATVGQCSNVKSTDKVWGSPNARRRAGYRPRSGLFHKKDGRMGRKIRPIKTIFYSTKKAKENVLRYELHCPYFQHERPIIPSVNRNK